MRKQKSNTVKMECPVCGAGLIGSRTAGLQCVKCHSFFSARHMGRIRRLEFKSLVAKHFDATPSARTESSLERNHRNESREHELRESVSFTMRDEDGRIDEAINGLRDSVKKAAAQLESLDRRSGEIIDDSGHGDRSGARRGDIMMVIEKEAMKQTVMTSVKKVKIKTLGQKEVKKDANTKKKVKTKRKVMLSKVKKNKLTVKKNTSKVKKKVKRKMNRNASKRHKR